MIIAPPHGHVMLLSVLYLLLTGSGLEDVFLVIIALISVSLILLVLGLVVVIVVVFMKKEKKTDPEGKMVELKSSKTVQETQLLFAPDQTTISTYVTDKTLSYSSISFLRGHIHGDNFSLPRSSLILVDHLNSHAEQV